MEGPKSLEGLTPSGAFNQLFLEKKDELRDGAVDLDAPEFALPKEPEYGLKIRLPVYVLWASFMFASCSKLNFQIEHSMMVAIS